MDYARNNQKHRIQGGRTKIVISDDSIGIFGYGLADIRGTVRYVDMEKACDAWRD